MIHVKTAADTFRGSASSRFFNATNFAAASKAEGKRNEERARPTVGQAVSQFQPAQALPVSWCDATTRASYMGLTVAGMREIARDRGMVGYSKLKKAELAAELAR